eukprot:6214245-Pleurochrysis_carterae.AAC.2
MSEHEFELLTAQLEFLVCILQIYKDPRMQSDDNWNCVCEPKAMWSTGTCPRVAASKKPIQTYTDHIQPYAALLAGGLMCKV